MLSKEVIQEDDPDFAMRDYWSWKKKLCNWWSFNPFSISKSKWSNPKQCGTALSVTAPQTLGFAPKPTSYHYAIWCQKVQKIRFLVICFIEYNYSILLTSNNFMLTRAVGQNYFSGRDVVDKKMVRPKNLVEFFRLHNPCWYLSAYLRRW